MGDTSFISAINVHCIDEAIGVSLFTFISYREMLNLE